MLNVTAATTAESKAAIASLRVGNVLSFLYERGELYSVTSVETYTCGDFSEAIVWVQCRRRTDRRARLRASLDGKSGFRFQVAEKMRFAIPNSIPGFEIIA